MKRISLMAATIFIGQYVWAWADLGHSTVGYIADKNLTPVAKLMVQNIVGVEPLAISATWPDAARADERFKKYAPYHFFEIPNGYKAATVPPELWAEQDARTIIEKGVKRMLEVGTPREEKMIWFRYLVHVVGDVHQPLHVGNGLDLGGNICDVQFTNAAAVVENTSLHSFWDEKIVGMIETEYNIKNPPPNGKKRWFGYVELGELLFTQFPEITMATANTVAPADWYDESRSYHDIVYPDTDRLYCKSLDSMKKVIDGKYDATKIPLLDQAYIDKALPLAKKQILKAGFRLAKILNDMSLKYKKSALSMATPLDTVKILLKNDKTAAGHASNDKPKKERKPAKTK